MDFNNFMAKAIEKRLLQGPKLPDVTSSTFFKVKIFSIRIKININTRSSTITFPSIYQQEII